MNWVYIDRLAHKIWTPRDRFGRVRWWICQRAMLWADKNDRWDLYD